MQLGIESLVVATVGLIGDVTRSVARAMVALFLGVALGTVAGLLYAVFRPVETQVHDYFSAASQVGVGVLIALVVELRATKGFLEASFLERQPRVGTLILTAVGCCASLAGTLVTGSAVASGSLFGLSWGGSTAGVTGLFMLLLYRADSHSSLGGEG